MKIILEDIKNISKYQNILKNKKIKEVKLQKINKENPREKELSILGETILIKALQDYYNLDYDTINIIYNQNGKPYIEGYNIFFNISHYNTKVIVVIDTIELGIDIIDNKQKIRSISNYLNQDEKLIIEKQILTPIQLFALKEAQIKCDGLSILDFKNIIISSRYSYILIREKEYTIAICKKR